MSGRQLSWKTKIGLLLVGLSLLLAILHSAVFRDPRTLLFYLALDIAFGVGILFKICTPELHQVFA